MNSRRNPVAHKIDCGCGWCGHPYGPADHYEAWEGIKEHLLGIAIVVALAAFAAFAALVR